MEEELKCANCRQFFTNPVLLPCYHALCLNCALQIQLPLHPDEQLEQQHNSVNTFEQNFQSNHHNNLVFPPNHAQVPVNNNLVITTATVHSHSHHHQHQHNQHSHLTNHYRSDSNSTSSEIGSSESSSGAEDGSDKVSIVSETDSGVIAYNHARSSRANSILSTIPPPELHGFLFPPVQTTSFSLSCPVCTKLIYFDDSGAYNLPRYRILQNIVDKYVESRNLGIKCQLCEKNPQMSTIMCEQCEIFYCDTCRENCHPARGPLASHSLVSAPQGKIHLKMRSGPLEYKCADHANQVLNMYCISCKILVCVVCFDERRHTDHDVQPIKMMSKVQKTELSQRLHTLSERAKSGTEFIQRLKAQADKISENCFHVESHVAAQIDAIINTLQNRKQELVAYIQREKEYKLKSLKSDVSSNAQRLQQTTALIQFCIEALKETDPCAYLQVGSLLAARVANMEAAWQTEDESLNSTGNPGKTASTHFITARKPPTPRFSSLTSASSYSHIVSSDFDLTLDDRCLLNAIRQLNFIQMRPTKDGEERLPAVPGLPVIIPEGCSTLNNSATVSWQPPPTSLVDGYVLEIDDGIGGPFREVYCGKETVCTVDGLHFGSVYNVRVKAFNSTGDGNYSETVGLQTSEVAWFTFEPSLVPQGVRLSNQNLTVTSDSYEPRVILGNIGFSRGVHYWEFVVDKYDASADPSFGIARLDVGKDEMLGKDDKGWGMYIDHQRSWFIHGGVHSCRSDGGIQAGSTIGVQLDLERRQLTFYVNEEQQGPIAFSNLFGVYYPAVSINCNVTLTLHSGLDCPSDSDDSGAKC